jgi:protein-L-isoaspartate(D-aspartate) O-methyltransferase
MTNDHAYQPQQSVLKPHAGQRQTACMRYISAPQRSHNVFWSASGVADKLVLSGMGRAGGLPGASGSDMGRIMAWIDEQLVARGIRDPRVLDAMLRVPREKFVPSDVRSQAYADRALSIGSGQTISQPYMVAIMTEALRLRGGERVLEIGTGSGYQAAILAELAGSVTTIERIANLAETARATLAALGYANIEVIAGDGTVGYAPAAPFDGILVAAGAPRVPDSLRQQLSTTGGRLVIPIGPPEQQRLTIVSREGERFTESIHEACVFVPLRGVEGWPA